jgi:lipid A disaccharide synthetase
MRCARAAACGRARNTQVHHEQTAGRRGGSRRSEIEYIAPRFLQAVALLHERRPSLRFVLPIAPGLRAMVEPIAARDAPRVPILLLDGRSHEALAACDVTLIASGTATLEAALFKRPMVIGCGCIRCLPARGRMAAAWVGHRHPGSSSWY